MLRPLSQISIDRTIYGFQKQVQLFFLEEDYLQKAVEAARTVTSRQADIGREGRVAAAGQEALLSRRGILAEKSPFMTLSQRRDFDLQTKLSGLGYQRGELNQNLYKWKKIRIF